MRASDRARLERVSKVGGAPTKAPLAAKISRVANQRAWDQDATNMASLLTTAETSLSSIAEGYGATEKQAADMWSNVGL